MAHGLPDWGLVGPKQTTYGLDDVGELAARLGSPVVWDRRGDVIFMDNFENGLGKIIVTPFGTGANYNLTCGNVWHGAYALELTAGNDGPFHGVHVVWFTPLPYTSNMGWEIWFSVTEDVSIILLGFIWYENPTLCTAAIRYDHVNKVLEYGDAAGIWQTVAAGIDLLEHPKPIHMLKLVACPTTQQYVRVILDDVQYSLSGYTMPVAAYAGQDYLTSVMYYQGVLGENPKIVIDNAIFTENEPS